MRERLGHENLDVYKLAKQFAVELWQVVSFDTASLDDALELRLTPYA